MAEKTGGPPVEPEEKRHRESVKTEEDSSDGPDLEGSEGDATDDGASGEEDPGAHESDAEKLQRLTEEHRRLVDEYEKLQRAFQELKDARLRLQADFDNFRRRTREEEERRKQEAAEDIIRDLLPVVDNMERALQAAKADGQAPTSSADEGIRTGVEMILQQLLAVLDKRGVSPAPGIGEPFDPQWHHAVATVDAEQPEDGFVVIEEFQKGYVLGGRAVRPSMVTVGPKSALEGGDMRKGNER